MKKSLIYFILFFALISFSTAVLNDSKMYLAFDINGAIYDTSGNNANGTIYNALYTSYGKINGGYTNFGNISFIDDSDIDSYNNFTINVWVNKSSATTQSSIASKHRSGGNGWDIGIYNDKIYVLSKSGSQCELIDTGTTFGDNVYTFISVAFDNAIVKVYFNGVNTVNKTSCPTGNLSNNENFVIGWTTVGLATGNIALDELSYYDRILTDNEILQLYNNGTGYNPYNITINVTPTPKTYNITNLQRPNNINTSVFYLDINSTVTGNLSDTENSSVILYFKPFTALNSGCSIFYGKECYFNSSNYFNKSMTRINDSSFYTDIQDTELYPAYYPFNYQYINNNLGFNYSAYNNNHIKFNIFNFSTQVSDYFIALEFDALNSSTDSANLLIYYCNSTYVNGNPAINSNCELISNFAPTARYNHIHNNSRHQLIPVKIQNIAKTQVSYILFIAQGNAPQAWNFRYVLNSSYDNSSFNTGQYTGWDATNKIFDVHIHPYRDDDYFRYYTVYNDGTGITATSNITTDFYDVEHFPPSTTDFLQPNSSGVYTVDYTGATTTSIYSQWLPSTSVNNFSITYDLYICNDAIIKRCKSIINDTPATNYTFNISYSDITSIFLLSASNSDYFMSLTSRDSADFESTSDENDRFKLCINDWQKYPQPCTDNVKLISYYDNAACSISYGLPADNGTYEACVPAPTIIQYEFDEFQLVLFVLTILLVLTIIGAALFARVFIFVAALIMGFMTATLIYYAVSDMLIVASAIMTLIFIAIGAFSLRS